MRITIICAGKLKERFYQDAVAEYTKRLNRYLRLEIIEVEDEKTPDGAGAALELQIKRREGERILKNIKDGAYVIALAIEGDAPSSTELADKLQNLSAGGNSHIVFIIGGSLGLSDAVLKKADWLLSFSKMTFPHQLMRVVLLEQIYRCCKIIKNEPYHK